jgi:hypothetical protein
MPPLKKMHNSSLIGNAALEKDPPSLPEKLPERPHLYVNDFPEDFKTVVQDTSEELKNSPSLKGKGALIYSLPPKTTLLIKQNGLSLIRVNSAIQKDGCFYRNAGKKTELVLKTALGSKKFEWSPKKGKVDILY